MDLTIRCSDNEKDAITKVAMAQINQSAGCEFEWKIEHIGDTIFCSLKTYRYEDEIVASLGKLLETYQSLDISASYSYSIREEDGSADWWESVSISTKVNDEGVKYLDRDSSTYWN